MASLRIATSGAGDLAVGDDGFDDQLGAVLDVEARKDSFEMRANGPFGHMQGDGDLFIAETDDNQMRDLGLLRRKVKGKHNVLPFFR